jgi:hypothetical protein
LIALKRFVEEDFDILLEDNVRAPIDQCADLIRMARSASDQLYADRGVECHFRFFGWLGSTKNLEYLLHTHAKKRAYPTPDSGHPVAVFPFPQLRYLNEDLEDLDEDEAENVVVEEEENAVVHDEKSSCTTHSRPGGNFVYVLAY